MTPLNGFVAMISLLYLMVEWILLSCRLSLRSVAFPFFGKLLSLAVERSG
jgi:hypothetical protein